MMSWGRLFVLSLFFSYSAFGKLITYDHTSTGYKAYTWKEVCKMLVKRDSPLIEKAGTSQLDCMGKVVKVRNFCEQREASNPYYTRALVFEHDETVRCYSGKKVFVKWKCDGKSDMYCKDKDIGCFYFKENLASRLDLSHSSIINDHLNCYFNIKTDIYGANFGL